MPLLRHERARERCSPIRPACRRYKSRCRLFSIIYGLNLTTSTVVPPRRRRRTSTPHFGKHTETSASTDVYYTLLLSYTRGDARQKNIIIAGEYLTWSAVEDTTGCGQKKALIIYTIFIASSGCAHS